MTSLVARQVALPGRLQPIDLDVRAGELVAIVGPNGGGKTSLLRALARIEKAAGVVAIDGEDLDQSPLARLRQLLAFLPASRDVTWPIASRDVIALGLGRADIARIDRLIALLELEELADRPINRLSTGERARILLARALAPTPSVLLLDEPLSNLDPYWVLRILSILEAAARSGQAVLVALHDLSLLQRFDRVLLIADGRLQMDETPAVLMASERFKTVFRIHAIDGGWALAQQPGRGGAVTS